MGRLMAASVCVCEMDFEQAHLATTKYSNVCFLKIFVIPVGINCSKRMPSNVCNSVARHHISCL